MRYRMWMIARDPPAWAGDPLKCRGASEADLRSVRNSVWLAPFHVKPSLRRQPKRSWDHPGVRRKPHSPAGERA